MFLAHDLNVGEIFSKINQNMCVRMKRDLLEKSKPGVCRFLKPDAGSDGILGSKDSQR